ncbi:uncharacterized protein MYCGRDRAFT_106674 [Zymoseptoria tritici IPO323]|uniref:Uncharacterized protein n=1 Tax=Zymoseptoria tritici (strain CBS 115943 / IPO323) TaxID=336722 RepID=F9XRS9_ZYMTI|nr:uncharacterized protein MYCGRDRAFT_106674 [Zymoseptoria tritici IPO323]EGP82043.1 hypothetical protein MYCGRDRAFT_106674 [Zymoseptoria tritici IPO323]
MIAVLSQVIKHRSLLVTPSTRTTARRLPPSLWYPTSFQPDRLLFPLRSYTRRRSPKTGLCKAYTACRLSGKSS